MLNLLGFYLIAIGAAPVQDVSKFHDWRLFYRHKTQTKNKKNETENFIWYLPIIWANVY